MALGVYPGSFNPPTVAHLAVAEAALAHAGLDRLDLALSDVPLGKEGVAIPTLEDRLALLAEIAAPRPRLGTLRTTRRLIADIADGYDVVVVGADKWAQVVDPAWYGGSTAARDAAVARLPRVLVVARAGFRSDPAWLGAAEPLEIGPLHSEVSSSAVRAGRTEWMLPEAVDFDRRTGAWSDPPRYATARGLTDPPAPAR